MEPKSKYRALYGFLFFFIFNSIGLYVINMVYRNEITRLRAHIFNNETLPEMLKAVELERAIILESSIIAKELPDFSFESFTEEVFTKNHFKSRKYTVVLLSAFSNCSQCRDSELELWRDFVDGIEVVGIASDFDLTDEHIFQIEKYIRANRLNFKWFFDRNHYLLDYFKLKPDQPPLTLLVNHNGNIVLAHQALADQPEKTKRFQHLIDNLLKNSKVI